VFNYVFICLHILLAFACICLQIFVVFFGSSVFPVSSVVRSSVLLVSFARNKYTNMEKDDKPESALILTLRKDDQEWIANITETTETTEKTDDETLPCVTITWGKHGGKMQTKRDMYTAGKQTRTPLQQARFETISEAKKKIRKGYVFDPDASLGVLSTEIDALCKEVELAACAPTPMLAETFSAKRKAALPPAVRTFVQPKLDGVRCLANLNTGELFSRGRKENKALPHVSVAVKALRALFPIDVVWLDGELYAHGVGFQTITSLSKGNEHTTKGAGSGSGLTAESLQLWVYDVVSPLPFGDRAALLSVLPQALFFDSAVSASAASASASTSASASSLSSRTVVVAVPTTPIVFDKDANELHVKYVQSKFEGSMLRVDGVGYEQNKRSLSLLKRKDFQQEEFRVLAFERETHADTLGSVLISTDGSSDVEHATRATPAMSDAEKLSIWQHQDSYIGQMATVKFQERTESGALRFPVLLGFRHPDDMADPDDDPDKDDAIKEKTKKTTHTAKTGTKEKKGRAQTKTETQKGDKGDTTSGSKRKRKHNRDHTEKEAEKADEDDEADD